MKKIASLMVFMLIISSIYSQSFYSVPYYNWSSKISFMLSPSPMITGYGFLSDSLSKIHPDTTFYEYNGEYYPITSWADYYFWYVNKYWYYFDDPGLYEYYYYVGDDYGMAQYICVRNYSGYTFPARIAITFPGRQVYMNDYSAYKVKRRLKNDNWENKNYVAINETDIKELNHRNRTTLANNSNIRSKNVNNIAGERKIKQKSIKERDFSYTNGPSNFERNNKGERTITANNLRTRSGTYENTNIRVNNNSGSNSHNVRSSTRNSTSTNRVNNSSSNNSIQTQTSKSGRAR